MSDINVRFDWVVDGSFVVIFEFPVWLESKKAVVEFRMIKFVGHM